MSSTKRINKGGFSRRVQRKSVIVSGLWETYKHKSAHHSNNQKIPSARMTAGTSTLKKVVQKTIKKIVY